MIEAPSYISKNEMDMVQAKLSFTTNRSRNEYSQFFLLWVEMRIMIQIQNYSKHHCNGKVIWESENETTLLLFYHRLQGTAHSQQRNHPQEQPHCTKGNNMIYCLILAIFPFSKDILNWNICILAIEKWLATVTGYKPFWMSQSMDSHPDPVSHWWIPVQ